MGKDVPRERPDRDRASKPRKFGPSQASVHVAPGQTEGQVLSVMRSILGRPRAALREAANLAGAPDDAGVTVGVMPRQGRRVIQIVTQNDMIYLQALLYPGLDGSPVLENEEVNINEEIQRHGLGTRLIGRQVEHGVRLGVAEIRAYAVRDDGMGYVGYWVWPLLGFDGALPAEIRRRLPRDLAWASRVSHLISSKEGQAWWWDHGDSVSVVFNLKPGSPALRHFRGYLRRKGLP